MRFLLAILFSLWCAVAHATFVQTKSADSMTSAASVTATFTSGVGTGNCVWGIAYYGAVNAGPFTSITVGGVTATQLDFITNIGDGTGAVMFILGNISGSPTAVTVNVSPSNVVAVVAVEESGCLAASNPTDVHTGQTFTSLGPGANAITSGTQTTTVANDIIVGAVVNTSNGDNPTAGTSPNTFTRQSVLNDGSVDVIAVEDGVTQVSTGSVAAIWGSPSTISGAAWMIAIKPTAGGGSTCPKTRALTHAGC